MGKVWSKANKDFSLIFLPFGSMQAIGKFLKKKKKVVTRVASNERRLKKLRSMCKMLINIIQTDMFYVSILLLHFMLLLND